MLATYASWPPMFCRLNLLEIRQSLESVKSHGIRENPSNPWSTRKSRESMKFDGKPWIPWKCMEIHGIRGKSKKLEYWISCKSRKSRGNRKSRKSRKVEKGENNKSRKVGKAGKTGKTKKTEIDYFRQAYTCTWSREGFLLTFTHSMGLQLFDGFSTEC